MRRSAGAGSGGDTIVAVSTAIGPGAIGIVRLSGPDAVDIAQAAFRPAHEKPLQTADSYTLRYGHVVDPDSAEVVDEALLAVMRAPRSYTREDVAELQCHGGVAAQRAVLRVMVRLGARPAEPGEFTRRAFLNGRIDLSQAESVARIVAARSTGALRAAVRQLDGGLSARVRAARHELVGLLARVEVAVDFSDEDVDPVDWNAVRDGLGGVLDELERLLGTALVGRLLEEGVRTAICGAPNAGKSSLLNALVMRERAIVSDTPGTTRDTVEELVEIAGMPVHLIDTAGLRSGGDAVEQLGVARAMKAMEQADVVLAVVDLAVPQGAAERRLLGHAERGRWVVVGNKADLVGGVSEGAHALEARLQAAGLAEWATGAGAQEGGRTAHTCVVSALTGEGVDTLREKIRDAVTGGAAFGLDEPILATERHRALVGEAVLRTKEALAAVERGEWEELVCEDIRGAARALGRITGEEVTGDLLDEIFSRFCLGK
jgi:tRNA modification GTPase